MLNLTKKRTQPSEELCDTLLLVIETLLDAVEVHTVPIDQADCEEFRADMRNLREAFVQPSAAGMLVASSSLKKIIEAYNQRARFLGMHTTEMQKAITNLTDVLAAILGAQESSITRLRDLQHSLAKASSMEGVRTLGAQLSGCLEEIRADAIGRRERTEQTLSELRRKLEDPSKSELGGPEQGSEAAGGVLTRAQAEATLDRIMQEGGHGYVAAFAVGRVQLINSRFGYAAGDEILALVQEHLRQNLQPGDQLFRWTGPVFLATMNRATMERARVEANRLASAKLQTTVQLDDRSVLLPVTCTSVILSLFDAPSAPVLIQQIDAFAASRIRS